MAYTPRLTPPSESDLHWIQVNSGGYNQCIYGSNGAPSVLPNCTGYVHGRVMEIRGVTTDDSGLSFRNAYYYYTGSTGWQQSQVPTLGAVACFATAGGTEPGHVAVVEQISADGNSITLSQSNWGGTRWELATAYKSQNWNWGGSGVTFLGFLTNPYVDGGDTPTPQPPVTPVARKHRKFLLMLRSPALYD